MKFGIGLVFLLIAQLSVGSPIQLATVIMDDDSAGNLEKVTCISDKTDNCNQNLCALPSPISESPDCQDICKQNAIKECQNNQ